MFHLLGSAHCNDTLMCVRPVKRLKKNVCRQCLPIGQSMWDTVQMLLLSLHDLSHQYWWHKISVTLASCQGLVEMLHCRVIDASNGDNP